MKEANKSWWKKVDYFHFHACQVYFSICSIILHSRVLIKITSYKMYETYIKFLPHSVKMSRSEKFIVPLWNPIVINFSYLYKWKVMKNYGHFRVMNSFNAISPWYEMKIFSKVYGIIRWIFSSIIENCFVMAVLCMKAINT